MASNGADRDLAAGLLAACSLVLLACGACSGPSGPAPSAEAVTASPGRGPDAPPPAAATPPASQATPLPPVALLPQSQWRRLSVGAIPNVASASAASRVREVQPGIRQVWVAVNLVDPIPLPETGGHARSMAFLADYRCGQAEAWDPIEIVWFQERNAARIALRERPRGPEGLRQVSDGTLNDAFVEAICGLPLRR